MCPLGLNYLMFRYIHYHFALVTLIFHVMLFDTWLECFSDHHQVQILERWGACWMFSTAILSVTKAIGSVTYPFCPHIFAPLAKCFETRHLRGEIKIFVIPQDTLLQQVDLDMCPANRKVLRNVQIHLGGEFLSMLLGGRTRSYRMDTLQVDLVKTIPLGEIEN